jgi:hypothetical protein
MMFFVTGASGSGKSASLPGLRAALLNMDWRDFDEFGVPSPCGPQRPRSCRQVILDEVDDVARHDRPSPYPSLEWDHASLP